MHLRPNGRTRRRAVAAALLGAVTLGMAAPAWGHASFSAAATFNFLPNTRGGTGLPGSTLPYDAASTYTLYARVPFEQVDPFNGADDTTVDVQVEVPAGWTNAACGTANVNVIDVTTNNTNQPGAVVGGWSCTVDHGTHDVVHFSGPQVSLPQTYLDSPQWFSIQVQTPSPTVQTAYDGTNGTEGFIISQTYASGEVSYWIPNAAYPGNPPVGANVSVASGLKRTVYAPVPKIDVSVAPYTLNGHKDDTKFVVTVANNDSTDFTVSDTDVANTITVNGNGVEDTITVLHAATKTLKPGKSTKYTFDWHHGSSLRLGDVSAVHSCVTVSTGDGPKQRCGDATAPNGSSEATVTTTAPPLTSKKTVVKFTSSILNAGTANLLLRSSNVEITIEVNDIPYASTITSITDPAKRKLLKPGKTARYSFSGTLPQLFVGDDVHVTTCVNPPADTNPSDNCSLVHLDIAK